MKSLKNVEDEFLFRLVKKDNAEAFTEIYGRYTHQLVRFTVNKLYNLDETEDLVQDVLLKIWIDRHTLDLKGTLKSYLYTVTRNKVTDVFRRRLHQDYYKIVLSGLHTEEAYTVEQLYQVKEFQARLNSYVEELNPRTKEIFKLSREKHYSISEIAIQMNISEQTVKNQLSIALKYLRGRLLTGMIVLTLAYPYYLV